MIHILYAMLRLPVYIYIYIYVYDVIYIYTRPDLSLSSDRKQN